MSAPTMLNRGNVPGEPGSESIGLNKFIVQSPLVIPSMFNMIGFRNPTLQQIPCKTVNEITYPPMRVAATPVDSGYNSYMFGRGDKVPKKERMFHDPYFKLNNPSMMSAPMFLFGNNPMPNHCLVAK